LDPVSPLPAIAALILALATSFVLAKKFGAPPIMGRFASIDGLRGFLAFFVFLHHSCIWYFYLQNGVWRTPPSNLYTHFGQSSVALFFMITGFLFFSKLIDGRVREIDWVRLYVSRFLRLVPLYIFVMALLFLVVAILSDWVLKEPVQKLILGMIKWSVFTIFGGPNLNGMGNTGLIVARVTWSLPFEWIFYFSLPLLALTIKVPLPLGYLVLSAVGVILILIHPSLNYLTFFGGIIAAVLVRFHWICKIFTHRYSSFLALTFLFLTVFFFSTAYRAIPMIFLTGFFVIIASGNSLFGILNNIASRTLGEFAYGIYLIHGVFLFVTFNFVFGLANIRLLSVFEYWSIVFLVTPVLIAICFLSYRFIEHPAMQRTTQLTNWLRSFSNIKLQLRK